MKKLFTLIFIAGVLINVSCAEDISYEAVSLQPEINYDLNKMSYEKVLTHLGQPNDILYDTVAGIPIMEFCYTDAVMLGSYRKYSKSDTDEPVFVHVYFKNDSVYSVKTNMLKQIPVPKNQNGVVEVILIILVALLLLLAALWADYCSEIKNYIIDVRNYLCVAKNHSASMEIYLNELNTKTNKFYHDFSVQTHKDINELKTEANRAYVKFFDQAQFSSQMQKDINELTTKANKFYRELMPAIKSLSYTIENGLDGAHSHLTMLGSESDGADVEDENLPSQTESTISDNAIDKDLKNFLDTDIEISNLPTSVKTVLRVRTNIRKMGQLCTLSKREILGIVGLGAGARHRIVDEFERYGLSLGTDLSDYGYPRRDPEIEGSIRHIVKLTV